MMFLKCLSLLLFLLLSQCGSKSGEGDRFKESEVRAFSGFAASLPSATQFTFAVVGDLHVGGGDTTRFRRVLESARSAGDSFIILLGDIVDKGVRTDVEAVRAALNDFGYLNKVLPVIGNHDVFEDGWSAYRDLFGPSHYSVSIGNSKFIALDTADGSVGKTQTDWLALQLNQRTETHAFILSHYLPVIPTQRTYLKLADEDESLRLMKLATQHRVSAWLGAHYHSFIVGSVEGVSYVVAGGGGGRRMEPIKRFFYVQATVSGVSVSFLSKLVD